MNLSDLLITYNQVKAPTEIVEQFSNQNNLPNPNSSKFERFMEYLNIKKDKESSNNSSNNIVKEDTGFPGWENSGASSGNGLSESTGTTVSRPSNSKFGDNFDRKWNLAISQEPETINTKLSIYENSDNLKQYKADLVEFYKTDYGKKFDPNAINISNETRKKRQELENQLIKIAAIESGFNQQAINKNIDPKYTAFGYFQLLRDTIENYKNENNKNYNYDDVVKNPSLQFEIAYKRLLFAHKELNNWKNKIHSNEKLNKFTPFQIIYAHWWHPQTTKSFFKETQTDEDKTIIGQPRGGMNILRILARARE